MNKYIILAQSTHTSNALEAFLTMFIKELRNLDQKDFDNEVGKIIWFDSSVDLETYYHITHEILKKTDYEKNSITISNVVVIVDTVNLSYLNPLVTTGWDSVISMLILTFPEVHWIFGVFQGADFFDKSTKNIIREHGLSSILETISDPLFDGTGLREWVRTKIRAEGSESLEKANYLPIRKNIAIAIDDERSYAYFHCYTAYRYGFRTFPIIKESSLNRLLGEDGSLCENDQLRLSIEDLFLNFPDRSTKHRDTQWSDLIQRSEKLPGLNQFSVLRIFVTSGQKSGSYDEKKYKNNEFLKKLKNEGRLGKTIIKPSSGIFDLWKMSGLYKNLHDGGRNGQAALFIWPPRNNESTQDEFTHDHSAPGRLLEIATTLITRGEKLLSNVITVEDAVHGAVLAVDAMELLGEKAQTTFLHALALKHEFETKAECHFYGVQNHFDVKSRIKDIKLEVNELSRYFDHSKQKEAKWNAEVSILNRLITNYQESHQFDEQHALQIRSRKIHRRLWFKKKFGYWGDQLRFINPIYWVASYIHGLLKSIPVFLLALIFWIFGLSVLFTVTSPDSNVNSSDGYYRGLEDAFTSFFSIGNPIRHEDPSPNLPLSDTSVIPSPKMNMMKHLAQLDNRLSRLEENTRTIHLKIHQVKYPPRYVAIICLAILAGFIHLGVFISHLYSTVSRK